MNGGQNRINILHLQHSIRYFLSILDKISNNPAIKLSDFTPLIEILSELGAVNRLMVHCILHDHWNITDCIAKVNC